MRILVIDQYAEIGGAQRCLLDIAAGFRERRWEIHAAVPEGELLTRLRPICDRVLPIACGPFQPVRKTVRDSIRLLAQIPGQLRLPRSTLFDAIYVNGPRLMPAVALSHGSTPVIFHAHNVIAQRAAAGLLAASLRLSRTSVIASSNFVARSIAAANRLRVIRNGVPPSTSPRPTRNSRPTVAVLARIAPEKGQLEFIHAARIAREAIPQAQFVIAGAPIFASTAYYERVRAEAEQAGVTLTGWTNGTDVFLSQVDLLVVPSDATDATPRVILEAYAASTPVLAFAAGGIPELIEHGETGILVRDRRPETLAAAIVDALSNSAHLDRLAARALDRWRREFTVARLQKDVCAAIQDAVERRHQRNPLARTGAIAEA